MKIKQSVSAKILVVLLPLFLVAAGASVYLSYRYHEMQALDLLQSSAKAQSTVIKESLVQMMVTAQRVDDEFLRRITRTGDVENLGIWFFLDSLHLDRELLTPPRLQRLRLREFRPTPDRWLFAEKAFSTSEPQWLVQCEIGKHTEGLVHVLSAGRPLFLNTCDRLKVILPITADRRCQECHAVSAGSVLGAAYMEMPLDRIVSSLRSSARQTIGIFGLFSLIALGLGMLLFRLFVARPVKKLIGATRLIGGGQLDRPIQPGFPSDEFGELASSFDVMRVRLKESQEQLVREERLSSVGRMASTIVHDLRSPLTAVMLAIESVGKNGSDENRGMLNAVHSSILRVNRMAQELLDYSRGKLELRKENVNVHDFVNAIKAEFDPIFQRREIRLVVREDFAGTASFDRDRLTRALENIINNALDVVVPGGEVRLTVGHEGGDLIFSVSDNGPGIPEEIQGRIFHAFATFGKAKGTGLGLTITKEIIELHGGSISVDSRRGEGAVFTIRLPRGKNHERMRS